MATVEETTLRVQRMLTGPMGLKVSLQGETMVLTFSDASTAVFLRVFELGSAKDGSPRSVVWISVPILIGVPATPQLFEWVAKSQVDFVFGRLELAAREGPETMDLAMTHSLLANYLDEPELRAAVYGLLSTADELDDSLVERFGGKRWVDA